MPLQATSGAASYDAFGGGVAVVPNYIEDVFSTYLLVGNATTTTINNGIDLSGKGGLVWLKDRTGAGYHSLGDTARSGKRLFSNTSDAEVSANPFAFTSTGVTLNGAYLDSGRNFVTWTFRKQPKFFDVVTYTGNGTAGRTVAHNLGSVPACIIVKNTSASGDWWNVYHRSLGATKALFLNDTQAAGTYANVWNNTEPTSTVFSLGTSGEVNRNGDSFVAYLFAHDAGGFGLTGTDNVISCGSVVGASQVEVNLGWEPQWILVKNSSASQDWWLVDNMRGLPVQDTSSAYNASNLRPNLSDAETTGFSIAPSATGFKANVLTSGQTYIYIAIRRGPMKVPSTGTSVFAIDQNTSSPFAMTSGFPVDSWWYGDRSGSSKWFDFDRLRGNFYLQQNTTAAESAFTVKFDNMTGVALTSSNATGYIQYAFKRAPSFFDEVCYTGTGSARTVSHNLAAVPELMIVKCRSNAIDGWMVYSAALPASSKMILNRDYGELGGETTTWNSTRPTASVFSVGTEANVNNSGYTYVAYLFATCAGVSKVGSYTGTATTKQIDCGFTAGARFVLIKRVDSTGDWYVWDTARGIVSGNDSYLLLNSTAAEVTNTDYIDTYSAGFEISSTAPAAINANGGSFIFFAVA